MKISTTAYSFRKWKLSMKTSLPKTTNFTSGGFQTLVAAVTGATLSLEAPYNQGNMAFTCGTTYTWILGFTTGISITVAAYIETLEPAVDVEQEQVISITAQSSGGFSAAIT